MKKKIIVTFNIFILVFFIPRHVLALSWTPIQLTVKHPTQLFSKETNVYGLRLNLLYGINRNVSGIDIGTINKTKRDFRGIQVSGLANGVREYMQGIQISGLGNGADKVRGIQAGVLCNLSEDNLYGFQIGGIINYAEDLKGIQISPGLNSGGPVFNVLGSAGGQMRGIQIGGIGNVADDDRTMLVMQIAGIVNSEESRGKGIQIAGGINLSQFKKKGIQISGFGNYSHTIYGLQVAGIRNYAYGVKWIQITAGFNRNTNIRGMQFGLYNNAVDIKGIQLGIINYCSHEMEGVQIGLINVFRNKFLPIINPKF